jgi:hypothetical protein
MKTIAPDPNSQRAETIAYLTLGAAAVAGILLALPVSIDFGNTIDPVTARLERDSGRPGVHFVGSGAGSVTNLARGSARPRLNLGATNPVLPIRMTADPDATRSSS